MGGAGRPANSIHTQKNYEENQTTLVFQMVAYMVRKVWYEQSMVRIVYGTNSQWYERSMGRMVHGTNGLHVVRVVSGTNSLVIDVYDQH